MLSLEFTVEPFVEGQPGPHVTAAVAAAEALGATVEFGPFGSSCTVDVERCGDVASAVLRAAFSNGATHVSLHAETLHTETLHTETLHTETMRTETGSA